MTCDTEILGAAGLFGVNSLSTAVSGRDEKIQRQKEVLLVPLILHLWWLGWIALPFRSGLRPNFKR